MYQAGAALTLWNCLLHVPNSSLEIWAVVAQSVKWLGYGLDDRNSIPARGRDFFSSSPRLDLLWGPSNCQTNGYWSLIPGVKRSGHEADHSLPSGVDVKNVWSSTATPQYVFMAWCLVKRRDRSTFVFTFESRKLIW